MAGKRKLRGMSSVSAHPTETIPYSVFVMDQGVGRNLQEGVRIPGFKVDRPTGSTPNCCLGSFIEHSCSVIGLPQWEIGGK